MVLDQQDQHDDELDRILSRATKSGRSSRRSQYDLEEDDPTAFNEVCRVFIDKMYQAAQKDVEILARSQESSSAGMGPGVALEKVRMLPEVRSTCGKVRLRRALVSNGLLLAFKQWLDPIDKDRRILPSLDVRSTLLEILLDLPVEGVLDKSGTADWEGVSYDQLVESRIGQTLRLLMQHPKETGENREKARTLLRRFEKLLTPFAPVSSGSSLPTAARRATDSVGDELARKVAARGVSSVREFLRTETPDATLSRQLLFPTPAVLDFHRAPQGDFQEGERANSVPMKGPLERSFGTVFAPPSLSEGQKRIQKTMKEKKGSKAADRAVTVSIEGRHLL